MSKKRYDKELILHAARRDNALSGVQMKTKGDYFRVALGAKALGLVFK